MKDDGIGSACNTYRTDDKGVENLKSEVKRLHGRTGR